MTLSSQYKVMQSKIYDPLVSVQGQNEKQRPSRLSTRLVQKFNPHNPLVSVQGQFNSKSTTLSSQYKVSLRYGTLSS